MRPFYRRALFVAGVVALLAALDLGLGYAQPEPKKIPRIATMSPAAGQSLKQTPAQPDLLAHISWPKQAWRVLHNTYPGVVTMVFSPDGKFLAARVCSCSIKIWSVERGVLLHILSTFTSTAPEALAFSPNDHWFAAIAPDQTIKIYEVKSGKLQQAIPGEDDAVRQMAFSPDSTFLIVARSRGIGYWDLAAKQYRPGKARTKAAEFYQFALSPDGELLAEATVFGEIRVRQLVSGHLLRALKIPRRFPVYPAFSPDSKTLFALSEQGECYHWQIASGRQSGSFSLCRPGMIYQANFLPGNLLAAEGTFGQGLWDLATGKFLYALPAKENYYSETGFNPQGRLLALSNGEQIELRAARTGTVLHTLRPLEGNGITFSPDGRLLAAATWYDSIKIWQTPEAVWRPSPAYKPAIKNLEKLP